MMIVSYSELGRVGRLGNALYELAATAGIAHAYGVEPRFNADWIHRPFFSVPDHLFTDDFTGCTPAQDTSLAKHIDERARVYLQDWRLFEPILDTIRAWFSPSPEAESVMEIDVDPIWSMLHKPVLSVHVRRGDNAPGGDPGTPNKHLWHPMPPKAYYTQAVGELFKHEPGSIAVFSDDIEWCKTELPFGDYYHEGVSRPKEHEPDYLTAPILDWIDFQLQTRADMHVCSNSTFGIMAALLAGDTIADPVVPWPIYGPKLNYVRAELLFPETWTRLTARNG
jgi:hypothetical protein